MTTVPNGLAGGLVAALVAGGVTRTLREGPSLVAALVAARTGADPAAYRWWPAAVQVAAGSLAGGTLVALELLVLDALAIPPTAGEALALAVPYALVLLVASLGLRALLRGRPDRRTVARLLAGHLLYGIALGLWIRATWIT